MRSPGTGASYESVLTERGIPAERIFPFVRDHLMTRRMSYMQMAKALFDHFTLESKPGDLERLAKLWVADNKQAVWIPGAIEVVRTLRAKGRIVVLVTNSTAPGWQAVKSEIRREFDYVYISCDEGNVKPNDRVWETIESWFPTICRDEFAIVGDREVDDLAKPRERGWGAIPASEMQTLVGFYDSRPTTVIMDIWYAYSASEAKMRELGVNPIWTRELSNKLAGWEGWQKLNPDRTILVVPRNGGVVVAEELLRAIPAFWKSRVVEVNAKRIWNPGNDPWTLSNRIFPDKMVLGMQDVVVIDDVVASGATLRKIYELNQPWIPGAKWHALAWVAQRSASLPGDIHLFSAAQCGNFIKREPTISASTLAYDPEVLRSFAERNFPNNPTAYKILEGFRSIDHHIE